MDARVLNPASPNFLKRLSETLEKRLSNAPFDENIFTWCLYCLALGDKHLILRTSQRDLVQKTTKSILFSVFGLNTVVLRVKPEFTPEDLLAGLFPSAPSSSNAPSSFVPPVRSGTPGLGERKRSRQNSHPGRSSSYTRGPHLLPERLSHLIPPEAQLQGHGKFRLSVAATATGTDDERGSIRGLRPVSGRGYFPPEQDASSAMQPSPLNWHLPAHAQVAQLPHAVVITGLESASVAVQETLWDVLRTRTVVLEQEGGGQGNVWNLPEGFLLVYVCPLGDGSSRPAIQNSLLDRFSFSANIALHPPSSTPGLDPPRSPILRRVSLLKHEDLEELQRRIILAPMHDDLFMYITNLLSSIRHLPQLDAMLITSRCQRDLVDFTKASFILAGSSGNDAPRDDADDDTGTDAEGVRRIMSPVDVRRIIRHVVSHRLSVRESVHDEILGNLVSTAIQRSQTGPEADKSRRTVKEALNEAIMAV